MIGELVSFRDKADWMRLLDEQGKLMVWEESLQVKFPLLPLWKEEISHPSSV